VLNMNNDNPPDSTPAKTRKPRRSTPKAPAGTTARASANTTATPSDPLPAPVASSTASAEAIAERAYQLFASRGQEHGRDLDDWLQAEAELTAAPTRRKKGSTRVGSTARG
jgi:hypothetical protein